MTTIESAGAKLPVASSQLPVWFVEHCEICDADEVFLAGGLGLVACCLGCGDERIAPFTRTNSEVA
jgi:hypothetical protein